jgi:hypothetical protein
VESLIFFTNISAKSKQKFCNISWCSSEASEVMIHEKNETKKSHAIVPLSPCPIMNQRLLEYCPRLNTTVTTIIPIFMY